MAGFSALRAMHAAIEDWRTKRPGAATDANGGDAASLNFLDFGGRAAGRDSAAQAPERFVPHAWADRTDADEGLL